jgi:hypothetical protein
VIKIESAFMLKRQNQRAALDLVGSRVLEAAGILVYLVVKGFQPSPILSGDTGDARGNRSPAPPADH